MNRDIKETTIVFESKRTLKEKIPELCFATKGKRSRKKLPLPIVAVWPPEKSLHAF